MNATLLIVQIWTFLKMVASMTLGSRCISITQVFYPQIHSVRSTNSWLWTLVGSIPYIFSIVDARVAQTAQYNFFNKDGSQRPWKLPNAFTFNFINTFHLVNLQAQTSLYDFLSAIYHKSDGLGVVGIPVSIILQCGWSEDKWRGCGNCWGMFGTWWNLLSSYPHSASYTVWLC